jgi:hypothetical protein
VLPWSAALAGRLDEYVIDSVLLPDNPLGDPARRPLWVYVPPGYGSSRQHYPSVYVIQGYTGHLAMWRNRSPYRQPFPETADAVFAAGDVPPALVPFVDSRYRTLADRAHRAIGGKSSGGFGAMITPMLRPDLFGALASHAGDALYELCYLAEFGKAVRHLRDYDGDISAWWSDFKSRPAFTKPADESLLMTLGVSACFSARADGTPELPFDPQTGVLRPEVWQRWLDWDPVRMAPRYAQALRSLRAVWLDAGTRDEWYLDLGAQAFRDQLLAAGLPEERVHFELFDAGHGGIDYRYPLALAWLCRRIAEEAP